MIWLRYMGASIEEQTRMHEFGLYPLIDVRDRTDSFTGQSLRSDRPNGLVSRYIATDSFAGRSLRSDRPSGLVGHYVVTGSFADRSLRSDRLVRGPVAMWRPCLDLYLTFHERVLGLLMFSFDESPEFSARFYRKRSC
ncbi:hypothetical protein F2Q69_00023075 [Brassica cretica]|uniref:Uncharacterized protein n=1 Tax=Brassica cretica TaxID=69181 RepID=A0A8S9QC08_BRACR|nr:hypothetical protein F2Q69_00023075 [Brassica cretica]